MTKAIFRRSTTPLTHFYTKSHLFTFLSVEIWRYFFFGHFYVSFWQLMPIFHFDVVLRVSKLLFLNKKKHSDIAISSKFILKLKKQKITNEIWLNQIALHWIKQICLSIWICVSMYEHFNPEFQELKWPHHTSYEITITYHFKFKIKLSKMWIILTQFHKTKQKIDLLNKIEWIKII